MQVTENKEHWTLFYPYNIQACSRIISGCWISSLSKSISVFFNIMEFQNFSDGQYNFITKNKVSRAFKIFQRHTWGFFFAVASSYYLVYRSICKIKYKSSDTFSKHKPFGLDIHLRICCFFEIQKQELNEKFHNRLRNQVPTN